jgi:glycosyltransferase involved in cell wall biosynthesis
VSAERRILIFAYFFPPLGGAGVQRIVKFAKYLPTFGWRPTVVTVRARDYWMIDESLASELGDAVTVVRTGSLTGLGLLRRLAPREAGGRGAARRSAGRIRALRRIAAWTLLPDSYVGWLPFAVRAGRRLIERGRVDAILTTSSPDSAHLIGRQLTRRYRLPWIADFRDPWTRRLSFDPPTAWHRARQVAWERSVLAEAARVTVTSPETRRDYLERYPALEPQKIRVITNGFDEEDFAPLRGVAPPRERMEILHAGQLNPERPARPFLEALRLFFERQPAARERVRVRFIGPFYERDREDATRFGLAGQVGFQSGMRHGEIVGALCASHLLLLMEQDSERGGLILPGKIFEYLRARRPILGLLPHGAAWRLIEELGAGRCCRTGEASEAASLLDEFYKRFSENRLEPTPLDRQALERFERRSLAGELAAELETIIRGRDGPS